MGVELVGVVLVGVVLVGVVLVGVELVEGRGTGIYTRSSVGMTLLWDVRKWFLFP